MASPGKKNTAFSCARCKEQKGLLGRTVRIQAFFDGLLGLCFLILFLALALMAFVQVLFDQFRLVFFYRYILWCEVNQIGTI